MNSNRPVERREVKELAAPAATVTRQPRGYGRWFTMAAFAGIAAVANVAAGLSVKYLPMRPDVGIWRAYPSNPWLDGWTRWDAGWWCTIASRGYNFIGGSGGVQRPTHFFPVYALLMRAVGAVIGDVMLAGILVTLAAGLGCAIAFHEWCKHWLQSEATRIAVLVLLLYPFAFFLYGAVYSDALSLLLTLFAFVLLENDRPILAGLAGAVATGTRPVAPALVLGLVLRMLELRGFFAWTAGRSGKRSSWSLRFGRLRLRDGGVLLSVLGVGVYSFYLWRRFGDPLNWINTLEDWGVRSGPATWFKVGSFQQLAQGHWTYVQLFLLANLVPMILVLALLPHVFRRFGWAYGSYTVMALAIPFINDPELTGMGRYILPAFPCFAAAGDFLSRHRGAAWPLLAFSGTVMLGLLSAFARWYWLA